MNLPNKSRSLRSRVVFLFLFLLPGLVWAEVSPYDSEVPLAQDDLTNEGQNFSEGFNPNDPASLLAKINELQKSIQQLQGQVEVQSHALDQLKKQQQAYYEDLDQRISALSSGEKPKTLSLDTTVPTTTSEKETVSLEQKKVSTPIRMSAPVAGSDEITRYNEAYALVEQKRFPQATTAMKDFIHDYPHGQLTANAHYWLGELYLTAHQNQEAIKEFQTVINEYPSSNKVSSAMLKLGFVYASLGDKEKAKKQLQEIETLFPGTATAQLAQQRLRTLN